jgi:alkyl sulfatase BDS1-like metallo-beta-lactamase superfamily hydrolase
LWISLLVRYFAIRGIKLNGVDAADAASSISWTITGGEKPLSYLLELRNGVLIYTAGATYSAQVKATSTKAALSQALFSGRPLSDFAGEIAIDGDRAVVEELVGYLDEFPLWLQYRATLTANPRIDAASGPRVRLLVAPCQRFSVSSIPDDGAVA